MSDKTSNLVFDTFSYFSLSSGLIKPPVICCNLKILVSIFVAAT